MWNRITGVLVGIAVMTATERGLGFEWYWAFLIGVLAYLAVRYAGYFVRERRYIKNMMDAARRDEISN
jgi:hypothetical protein